jgi:flagellar basal body-associated protein FliL
MAEKAEKKAEAPAEKKPPAKGEAAPAAAAKGGGFLTKLPVLIGGVMLIEAVVLFAGFKFLNSGPKNANAADLTQPIKKDAGSADADASTAPDDSTTVELSLLESRFPNRRSGKSYLYDVKIFLSVKKQFADKVKAIITEHDALIQDRVRTIIAESDPDKLGGGSEPGLETLRRQVKYQLDEIVGDGMIDDVLFASAFAKDGEAWPSSRPPVKPHNNLRRRPPRQTWWRPRRQQPQPLITRLCRTRPWTTY